MTTKTIDDYRDMNHEERMKKREEYENFANFHSRQKQVVAQYHRMIKLIDEVEAEQ